MKAVFLVELSLACGAIVALGWMTTLLRCGLAPDGPVACNAFAERDAGNVLIDSFFFYLVLTVLFARWKRWGV